MGSRRSFLPPIKIDWCERRKKKTKCILYSPTSLLFLMQCNAEAKHWIFFARMFDETLCINVECRNCCYGNCTKCNCSTQKWWAIIHFAHDLYFCCWRECTEHNKHSNHFSLCFVFFSFISCTSIDIHFLALPILIKKFVLFLCFLLLWILSLETQIMWHLSSVEASPTHFQNTFFLLLFLNFVRSTNGDEDDQRKSTL